MALYLGCISTCQPLLSEVNLSRLHLTALLAGNPGSWYRCHHGINALPGLSEGIKTGHMEQRVEDLQQPGVDAMSQMFSQIPFQLLYDSRMGHNTLSAEHSVLDLYIIKDMLKMDTFLAPMEPIHLCSPNEGDLTLLVGWLNTKLRSHSEPKTGSMAKRTKSG